MPAPAAPTTSSNAPRRIPDQSSPAMTIESPSARGRKTRLRAWCSYAAFQRALRSRFTAQRNQTRMTRKKLRHPFAGCAPPDQFEQAQQNERFTNAKKKRSDHVTGPMRAQINSRITDRCSDKPVEPATAPIK